jgi:hypothetical protein
MSLAVRLYARVIDSKLASAPFEFDPYLCHLATFGSRRFTRTEEKLQRGESSWIDLGAYDLPRFEQDIYDDEQLVFEQFSRSHVSAVNEIDRAEGERVGRNTPSGVAMVSLRAILSTPYPEGDNYHTIPLFEMLAEQSGRSNAYGHYGRGKEAEVAENPDKALGKKLHAQIEKDIASYAFKGAIQLRYEILNHTLVQAYLDTPLPEIPGRLYYESPDLFAIAAKALHRAELTTWKRWSDLPVPENMQAEVESTRFSADPYEPLVQHLHMLRGETPAGPILPIAWTQQDMLLRGGIDPQADAASEADTLRFVELNLMSSLLRHGMSTRHFIATCERQAAQKDDTYFSSTTTAARAIADVPTFSANMINYSCDIAWGNLEWLRAQPLEKQRIYAPGLFANKTEHVGEPIENEESAYEIKDSLGQLSRLHAYGRWHYTISSFKRFAALHARNAGVDLTARRTIYGDEKTEGTKDANPYADRFEFKTMINSERWTPDPWAGATNSGDCDKYGLAAPSLFAVMQHVCTSEKAQARPLLRAAGLLLSKYTVFGSGMTSSSLKMDDSGAKKPAIQHIQLPRIGSADDKNWEEGGHSPAVMENKHWVLTAVLRAVDAGLVHEDDAEHVRTVLGAELEKLEPWTQDLPTLALEGTGFGSKLLLPSEETHASGDRANAFVAKERALIETARTIRIHEDPVLAPLAEFTRIQSQPYEWERRAEADQRISPFYRAFVHFLSPWLQGLVPTLGELIVCSNKGGVRTRGVAVGRWLRREEGILLAPKYAADFTIKEWQTEVEPYIACLRNLQPLSSWARARVPATNKLGQLLRTEDVRALASSGREEKLVAAALDALPGVPSKLPAPDADALKMIMDADAGETHAVLPLYAPGWKFSSAESGKVEGVLHALEKLKAQGQIAAYAFVRDQPMARCAPCVQILLAVCVENARTVKIQSHALTCAEPEMGEGDWSTLRFVASGYFIGTSHDATLRLPPPGSDESGIYRSDATYTQVDAGRVREIRALIMRYILDGLFMSRTEYEAREKSYPRAPDMGERIFIFNDDSVAIVADEFAELSAALLEIDPDLARNPGGLRSIRELRSALLEGYNGKGGDVRQRLHRVDFVGLQTESELLDLLLGPNSFRLPVDAQERRIVHSIWSRRVGFTDEQLWDRYVHKPVDGAQWTPQMLVWSGLLTGYLFKFMLRAIWAINVRPLRALATAYEPSDDDIFVLSSMTTEEKNLTYESFNVALAEAAQVEEAGETRAGEFVGLVLFNKTFFRFFFQRNAGTKKTATLREKIDANPSLSDMFKRAGEKHGIRLEPAYNTHESIDKFYH